jgi:hypothetical protein
MGKLREQWTYDREFVYEGKLYRRDEDYVPASILLNRLEPEYEYNPTRRDPIRCHLYNHQDFIGNRDLDWNFHKGFTIGKGKQLYWSLTWHRTGNATVYPINERSGRWVSGDVEITIHFK